MEEGELSYAVRPARRYCEEFERLKLQHLQSGGDAAAARAAAGTGPSVMNPYPHITAPLQLSYTAAEGIIYLPSGRGAIAATMTPPFPLQAAQDAAREKQLSDLAERAAVQSDDEEEGNAVDAEMAVADAMADAAANAVVVGGGPTQPRLRSRRTSAPTTMSEGAEEPRRSNRSR